MDISIFSNKYVLLFLTFWELIWKGIALWYAAKRNEKKIYILLLILNTIGLFPIGYLIHIKWIEKKPLGLGLD